MQRIVELTSAPVIGQTYLVPTMFREGHSIPIVGKLHSDKVLGIIPSQPHYHVDIRFAKKDLFVNLFDSDLFYAYPNDESRTAFRIFIILDNNNPYKVKEHPHECYRHWPFFYSQRLLDVTFTSGDTGKHHGKLEDAMEGKRVTGKYKLCPHQQIPLVGLQEYGGVVTCPGHLLDWCTSTGKLVRKVKKGTGKKMNWEDRCKEALDNRTFLAHNKEVSTDSPAFTQESNNATTSGEANNIHPAQENPHSLE